MMLVNSCYVCDTFANEFFNFENYKKVIRFKQNSIAYLIDAMINAALTKYFRLK